MDKLTVDSVKNFETEVDYTTVLDNFEGPLDLLLYLIKEEEIEIKDIFVSQVTEQFLSYMKALPYLDMEKASEYSGVYENGRWSIRYDENWTEVAEGGAYVLTAEPAATENALLGKAALRAADAEGAPLGGLTVAWQEVAYG